MGHLNETVLIVSIEIVIQSLLFHSELNKGVIYVWILK